jgi:hypothetical protein
VTCKIYNGRFGFHLHPSAPTSFTAYSVALWRGAHRPVSSLSSLRRHSNLWLVPMCNVVFSTSGLRQFAALAVRDPSVKAGALFLRPRFLRLHKAVSSTGLVFRKNRMIHTVPPVCLWPPCTHWASAFHSFPPQV